MDIGFSINLHDRDGRTYEEGFFLHIEPNTIIKIKDIKELNQFIKQLNKIKTEITENYDID